MQDGGGGDDYALDEMKNVKEQGRVTVTGCETENGVLQR
jgi:hypothetical protein